MFFECFGGVLGCFGTFVDILGHVWAFWDNLGRFFWKFLDVFGHFLEVVERFGICCGVLGHLGMFWGVVAQFEKFGTF